MNLPAQLGPIKETEINLLNGTTLRLPTCHPVFKKYRGTSINFTYGNKPILDYKGKPCFAELLILNLLLEKDWTGVWVETYGGTHFLQSMPQRWDLKEKNVTIPKDKKAILEKIKKTAKTTACFDVFVWKDNKILFLEAKRLGKDRLTLPQLKFIEGALYCGIPRKSMIIVEWSI